MRAAAGQIGASNRWVQTRCRKKFIREESTHGVPVGLTPAAADGKGLAAGVWPAATADAEAAS